MTTTKHSSTAEMRQQISEGKALIQKGDYLGAIKKYTTAAELNPEHPQPHLEIARVWHRNQRDLDKALIAYATAAGLEEKNAHAHFGAAIVLTERQQPGDEQDAMEWLNIAIELDPRNPLSLKKRGQLLARAKRYADAAADFAEAARLDPRDHKAAADLKRVRQLLKETHANQQSEWGYSKLGVTAG